MCRPSSFLPVVPEITEQTKQGISNSSGTSSSCSAEARSNSFRSRPQFVLPTIYEEECYEHAPNNVAHLKGLAAPDSSAFAIGPVFEEQLCAGQPESWQQWQDDVMDEDQLLLAAIEFRLQQLLYMKAQRQAAIAAARAAQQKQQQLLMQQAVQQYPQLLQASN